MENMTNKFFVLDRKLKRLFITYILAGIVFAVILSLCITVREYTLSVNETLDELLRLRRNMTKIAEATADMKHSIEAIDSIISPDFFANSSEKQLLMGLDVLKSNLKGVTIAVTEFSHKDTELSLPIVIKGPMRDYTSFVGDIGMMQAMKFPFFSIMGAIIKKGELDVIKEGGERVQRQTIIYEINGELRLPKSSQTLQAVGNGGNVPVAQHGDR
jgi:hypothetical protein